MWGFPVQSQKKTYFEIGVPKLLSVMLFGDPAARVQGLNDFPEDVHPPVFIVFQVYHVMIALGSLFALMSAIGAFLIFRNRLYDTTWYLKIILFASPLPLVSNEMGWMAAEIGRPPWAVYNILRTADAASVGVPAGQILFTIIMFSILYLVLFYFFIKYLVNMIKKGPAELISKSGY